MEKSADKQPEHHERDSIGRREPRSIFIIDGEKMTLICLKVKGGKSGRR